MAVLVTVSHVALAVLALLVLIQGFRPRAVGNLGQELADFGAKSEQ